MPKMTAWQLLYERLCFKPYKLKLLQVLSEGNTVRWAAICKDFIPRLEEEKTLNLNLVCSDAAVFHLYGTIRRNNMHILSSNDSITSVVWEWDSSKVHVFCALLKTKVYCTFFFAEPTIMGTMHLERVTNVVVPHFKEDLNCLITLPAGQSPPYWHTEVRWFLDEQLPGVI